MGSSGKNAGVAPRPAIVSAPHASTIASARRLEDMTEPHHEVLAFATAERSFDAQEDAVDGTEAEADPVVGLEIAEGKILGARCHLARIVEERAVDGGEDLPSVLGLEQQEIAIAETETAEAAQIVGA